MGNDIEISKTTALLMAGLFLAIVVGGYVVFGAGSSPAASGAAGGFAGSGGAQPGAVGQPDAGNGQPSAAGVQDVYIKALGTGSYDNSQVTVKKGIPVRLHFSAQANAGCGRAFYLDGFNVKLISYSGEEQVATFTPQQEGTFAYHCGMNMFRGRMVVAS